LKLERPEEGRTDEASKVHGRADYCCVEEHEAGATTADLARKRDIRGDILNWKAKFGGMDVSEAKRLKAGGGECEAEQAAGRADARCG
jgi:putative transposase